ncbi:MAG: hypothetical protein MUF21_10090, partial [Gemmatimonadaceae bacterium]|nr:hypothetical protein [Gemmatimonadaceae bacterium]
VGDAALLRLESSSRAARLYRVGDGDGGWRVLGIGADFVRLGGAGGERIVRLRRARGARE